MMVKMGMTVCEMWMVISGEIWIDGLPVGGIMTKFVDQPTAQYWLKHVTFVIVPLAKQKMN